MQGMSQSPGGRGAELGLASCPATPPSPQPPHAPISTHHRCFFNNFPFLYPKMTTQEGTGGMCLTENLCFLILENFHTLEMEKSIKMSQLGWEEQEQGCEVLVRMSTGM